MRVCLILFIVSQGAFRAPALPSEAAAIADYTNYNVGDVVQIRLQPVGQAEVSIHYAGESARVVSNIPVGGSGYTPLWTIPASARTGRYDVDVTTASGKTIPAATCFAVHRQLVKVLSVDLDKTFYTSGDSVNPTIKVRNVSDQPLENLQVEFEPYTYPWIAPDPDEPPMWKHIVAGSLSLAPGAEREFHVEKAAIVDAGKEPQGIYYSVVVRDSRNPDHIYDLAFALPAFTFPPNTPLPKQYPFLYLYWHQSEVVKSEAYRDFYPPEFVSSVIRFDTSHTIFRLALLPPSPFLSRRRISKTELTFAQECLMQQGVSWRIVSSRALLPDLIQQSSRRGTQAATCSRSR